MPYMLLVIGTLMSIAGAYAVVTGYGVIQVEEGWASVIAGATLFAGGIVTVGLGLVLRVLDHLRVALVTRPISDPVMDSLSLPDAPAFPVSPALAQPASKDWHQLGDANAEASSAAYDIPEADAPSPAPAPENPPETPPPADDYKLETPSTPEHDLVPAPRAPRAPVLPKSPPTKDWLDRAFAEFDQDVSDETPAKKATVAEPDLEEHVLHRPDPEPASAESEPAIAESAPASAAASAVIGRYEADGTSYVMYADGSIEAQTQTGVYRFASMAELKAFIES